MKDTLHFLHIPKTGGKAVKKTVREMREKGVKSDSYQLTLHDHFTTLPDLPSDESFIFAVRDPVDRFISSFYSLKRTCEKEDCFTPEFRKLYDLYPEVSDLLSDMFSSSEEKKERSQFAFSHHLQIGELGSYWYWFKDPEYLRNCAGRIFCVLSQDTLQKDFNRLMVQLEIDTPNTLPAWGEYESRTSPSDYQIEPKLARLLRQRQQSEYEFLQQLVDLRLIQDLPCSLTHVS